MDSLCHAFPELHCHPSGKLIYVILIAMASHSVLSWSLGVVR